MVSNRIRELRQKNGLTLKEMSKKLKENGVSLSASSLIKYERGERNPKLETWIELAKFFGVSTTYLQGLSNNSEPLFTPDSSPNELKGIIDFFNSQVKGEKSLSPSDLIQNINQLPTEQKAVTAGTFSNFLYCIDSLMENDEFQIVASLSNLLAIILSVQLMEGKQENIQEQVENYLNETIYKINKIHKDK